MSESSEAREDELTFIDLLAVVLRYRRGIIALNAAAWLCLAAAYAFLPGLLLDRRVATQPVEVIAQVAPAQTALSFIGEKPLLDRAASMASDPIIILDALRYAGIAELDHKDVSAAAGGVAVSVVRDWIKGESFAVSVMNGNLHLTLFTKDADRGSVFLSRLIDSVNASLFSSFAPIAAAEVEQFERFLSIGDASAPVLEAMAANYTRYQGALSYKSEASDALIAMHEPYVIAQPLNIATIRAELLGKGVLSLIGVFFLSFFLAFIRKAVDDIKNDPQAMKKLRSALDRR